MNKNELEKKIEQEIEQTFLSTPKRRRVTRFMAWCLGVGLLLLGVVLAAFTIYSRTDDFDQRVRALLVTTLEDATGGRVEVKHVQFALWHLAAEVDGLVIHGLEGPKEEPYISADKILVRIKLRNFLRHTAGKGPMRYIALNLLRVEQPHVHLIVNQDGTTNQPVPKKKSTNNEPVMDTLLDLRAAKVELAQGLVRYNNQAIPFNLAANQLALNVHYMPAPDHYGLTLGIDDLRTQMEKMPEAESHLQMEAELGRKLVQISSLTLYTGKNSTLHLSGKLEGFDHPVWQVGIKGDLEVPQISVLSGFPGLSSGRVTLDLAGHSCAVAPQVAQKQPHFWQRRHPQANPKNTQVLPPDPDCVKGYLLAGDAVWKNASYHDAYVRVVGVNGHAGLRVTPTDLLFQTLVVDLPGGGGNIAGNMRIHNWLGVVPEDAPVASPTIAAGQKTINTTAMAVKAKPPVTGSRAMPVVERAHAYVDVQMTRVALRSIMEITEPMHYQDLGFDTAVTGPVKAEWGGSTNDLPGSVVVTADLRLAPTGAHRNNAQNIPLSGIVQAEYRGGNESVVIRNLLAKTPQTSVSASGVLGVAKGDPLTNLKLDADFHDLSEFDSVLAATGFSENGKTGSSALPVALHGQAAFNGTAKGPIRTLDIQGHLDAQQIELKLDPSTDIQLDSVIADAEYTATSVSVAQSTIRRGTAVLNLSGVFQPHMVNERRTVRYVWDEQTQLEGRVQLVDANMRDVLDIVGQKDIPVTGTANANLHASGPLQALQGGGSISLRNGVAYDQPFDAINVTLGVQGKTVQVNHLQVNARGVQLLGNGSYSLDSKHLQAHLQGNNILLSNIESFRKANLPVDGRLNLLADADGTLEQPGLSAKLQLQDVTLNQQPIGQIQAEAHSKGSSIYLSSQGTLAQSHIDLNGNLQLQGEYPLQAALKFSNLDVAPILKIYGNTAVQASSNIAGQVTISGMAKKPAELTGDASLSQFQVVLQGIHLSTEKPMHASLHQGTVTLDALHILGQDTDLRAAGSIQILAPIGSTLPPQGGKLDVSASGGVDLGLVQVLYPNVRSSGKISFNVAAHGTTGKPGLAGKLTFENSNLAMADIPNGISNMKGTAVFTEDRLHLENITAESGGGKITLSGFLQFRGGLFADVTMTADTVRVRYYGVSATMNSTLRLQGNGDGATISGNVMITRFGIAETFDFASIAGGAGDVQIPPDPDSLLNKIRLNVRVQSAAALDFQNSYAKIAGTVDLNLRGTLAVPSVLGKINVTDGSATFNGTQYQLQRGQIYFNNPVRIDPTIDVDATARVENYDITIGVHGTSKNFKLTYRSEPPLSQADIFNLLAMGRTQEEAQLNTEQLQQQGQDPTTNAILGGALNATVSNRVNKLFGGAGKVKIDPAYVGTLGTTSARITVEQQVSRQVTVVFATNVNTTAEQLIQIQYQISPTKSIVVSRDENNVFSVVYKIRKRYK